MGPEGESGLGAGAWILCLRDETGSFEKISYGGRVLRNTSAMTAEREALRMGTERLDSLVSDKSKFVRFKGWKFRWKQYSTILTRSLCVSSVFTVKRSRMCCNVFSEHSVLFGPKLIRTTSGVLELISRFEFDFRCWGLFFERFEFLVCSGVHYMQ